MKNQLPLAFAALLLGATAQAAPFMAVGDGAELFATGMLGIRSDDNIFLSSGKAANPSAPVSATNPLLSEVDDLIITVTPGIDLTFGKNAQLQGALTMNVAFDNYLDNSRINTSLFNGDFVSKYDDGKMKLNFNLGYHELSQNSPDVRALSDIGVLTRRNIFSAGADGEVEVTQLTSFGAGVSYSDERFSHAARLRGYGDSDTLVIPLNFYYKWTPKVDFSLGYRYRDYQSGTANIAPDASDNFFTVGARGDFTPKLVGKFSVGYGQRDLAVGGNRSLLGLDASFTYEISPKTNLQFGASNDFGTSPQGQQEKNFTVNGMVSSKITETWMANVGLSYRAINFGTRTDDYFEGTVGATYIVNVNVNIVGGYTYRNYSSDLASGEFKNNVFSIAANFRY